MSNRTGVRARLLALGLVLSWAASPAAEAAGTKARLASAGADLDYFSRTIVWEGDTEASRLTGGAVSLDARFELGRDLTFSLAAGLSLGEANGLVFEGLPISLELGSTAVKGVVLGAGLEASIVKFGDFEIGAAGRFVSSFGLAKTWALEDFAVEGQASGRLNWMEAWAGPRLAYLAARGFLPYLELAARWIKIDYAMDEALGDLQAREKKKVRGDFAFSAAVGADIRLTDRLQVRAKAGIAPYAGGVDGVASLGVFYIF